MENIGILDPEGKNNNPLNNKPYTDDYKKYAKFWSSLPVYSKSHEIINDINENQVLLIQSSTGSGKSVIVPKLLLHTFNYNKKIAMTLPKQILAKSTADFAAKTLDVTVGEQVGYQYKGSPSSANNNDTLLLYATDGTIVSRIMNDPLLSDYGGIIIDEAHERKVQIDFLLYLLREVCRKREDFKLIIMSATINVDLFANYFYGIKFKSIDVGGGRLYPIDSHFLSSDLNYQEVLNKGFEILIKILERGVVENRANDIIFFVTSSNEANTLCKKLHNHLLEEKKTKCKITCDGDIFCVELYSGMDQNKQELAQDKELYKLNTNYKQKVVIATNVAESSLTVEGVRYVIDTGYELLSSYDPILMARKLDRVLISNAQAKQRMGRAGRTEPGVCYHLYTQNTFDNVMKKFPEPSIRTSDITPECLKLIVQLENTEKLIEVLANFIEPPKEAYIISAINTLIKLGAISQNKITNIGIMLNKINVNNIYFGLALICGKLYNCSRELIIIYAMIDICKANIMDLFNVPMGGTKEQMEKANKKLNKVREKYATKYGDVLALLNMYDSYKKNKNGEKFFKKIKFEKAIKEVNKMKQKFRNIHVTQDIGIGYNEKVLSMSIEDRIIYCLVIGFQLFTAVKKPDTTFYRIQHTSENIRINRSSFINFMKQLPVHIIYYELFVSMDKKELSIVSHIPNKVMKLLE